MLLLNLVAPQSPTGTPFPLPHATLVYCDNVRVIYIFGSPM